MAVKKGKSVIELRRRIAQMSRIEDDRERGEELTLEDVADRLHIKISTVRSLASTNQLPRYKVFGGNLFFAGEIARYRSLLIAESR